MSGDGGSGSAGKRIQLPWQTEGHYTEEVRRRQPSPEMQAIIAREMGRHRLMGANSAPSLYISSAKNNPYFALMYGVVAILVPTAIIASQPSYQAWMWWLSPIAILGLALLFLGALRVRKWHRTRKKVRSYAAESGEPFPDELRWNN